MNFPSREYIESLREKYPAGSRVRMNHMDDPYAPIESGTMGTLRLIDDGGNAHIDWDNGRGLSAVFGEDDFTIFPPEHTMRLYMPLSASLYTRNEWGDLDDYGDELSGHSLLAYEDEIAEALERERLPEEAKRGIMNWYGKNDSVNEKVRSVLFKLENREKQLWGVAECLVSGELNAEEMEKLKDYVTGQASDGWGEGFEQHEIRVDDGELYVSLWNSGNWDILTEQERFSPKFAAGLPELCFSTIKSTGELICIKRGESGYYPSDWSTEDRARNEELANTNNERLGVSDAQRKAMECGSMFGWLTPGADPKSYENKAPAQKMEQSFGSM